MPHFFTILKAPLKPFAIYSIYPSSFSLSSICSLLPSTNFSDVNILGRRIDYRQKLNVWRKCWGRRHAHKEKFDILSRHRLGKSSITKREYRLDQKQFKEWYLHYFSLHSVAVAGCIMYSPYIATAVFAVLQTALFLVATGMHSCRMEGTAKIIYYAVMIGVVILEVLLLFSLSMGVGASGYDLATRNCYLLQW